MSLKGRRSARQDKPKKNPKPTPAAINNGVETVLDQRVQGLSKWCSLYRKVKKADRMIESKLKNASELAARVMSNAHC